MASSTKKPLKPKSKQVLQHLLDNLDFVEENVIRAAREQPKLFMEASDYRIAKMRLRTRAEATLEALEADIALKLRADASERGEKVTEKAMAELLNSHQEIQAAKANMAEAVQGEEYSKLLIEAYRHRRDACRIIADMVRGDELSQRGGAKLMKDLNSRFPKR